MPCRLSSDPTSAHLSFDQSWGSLPPVDPGGGDSFAIPSACAPIQVGVSSVPGPITLPLEPISALKLSADHSKEIFNLTCEGRHLKEWVAREFIKLSSQEVLFHTQAQATSYKMVASRHLNHFTVYYMIMQSDEESGEARDKAIKVLCDWVGDVWLRANSMLFRHALDYETKLDVFLDKMRGLDQGAGGVHLDDDASNN